MRKRIWIPCVIALLAICFVAVLKTRQNQRAATLPPQQETATYQHMPPIKSKPAVTGSITNSSAGSPLIQAPETTIAEAVGRTNPEAAMLLTAWQGAIEFYGKVIDENGNPVTGAQVRFHWVEVPDETGNRRAMTESDAAGLFALHGQKGESLGVSVFKEGYYGSQRDNDTFKYSSIGGGQFSPDPQNPVIFHLRKRAVGALLVAVKENYQVPRDGAPVGINLTTGRTTTGSGSDLIVQCWTDDLGKPSGAKYDWRCRITPSGGLLATQEEFPFLAPEQGYVPSYEIEMPAERSGWKNEIELKFFYRLADGRFGRMTFSMIAGGQHFCMVNSLLNPSGSRNLEPLESGQQMPTPPSWAPPGTKAIIPEFK